MIRGEGFEHTIGFCGCAGSRHYPPVGHGLARRRFLSAGMVAALAGGASLLRPRPARAQSKLTPAEAMDRLTTGNDRFVAGHLTSFGQDLQALRQANIAGQEPFAGVLSCADSRVPPELVFDENIGQLFVTRVAGNVATPVVIASLEYGAAVLGVRAIMVLGHQSCGAVKAAIAGHAVPGQISALYAPLRPAIERAGSDVEAVAKTNAQIQANLLATASPVIAERIAAGSLKVVAAYYALATGKVTILG